MRYTPGDPMLDRHDPFSRPLSLRQIMDRLVEHAFVPPAGPAGQSASVGTLALDAYDEGDHVVVEAQLPGMQPEDIDLRIEQGVLTIQGETKAEDEHKERTYLIREHRTGPFSRSVRLPESVDSDAVQATYQDGVLRLTLPKAERTKTHRIQIGVGVQKSANGAQADGQDAKQPVTRGTSGRSS